MIISEQWLREWINPRLSVDGIAEKLTLAGVEVEKVSVAGSKLDNVVVAEITQIGPHPDADRLQICQVNTGKQSLMIVCGATNARVGLKTALAQVGAKLPNGMKIKTARVRGVVSNGMLCSATELGLQDQTDGIMELDINAPAGTNLSDYLTLDDHLIEVDLTPNRGDCLSILGTARELSVLTNIDLLQHDVPGVASVTKDRHAVEVRTQQDCPRYVSRVISDIDPQARTPDAMRERLSRCGIRPVSPVVDVTNYVMLELGQPMHAFDRANLVGAITVRHAKIKEQLTLLDGQKLILGKDTLVIADQAGVLALAGIMGGQNSGIGPATTDIVLEAAHFTPAAVAGRARAHGLQTDSSHRFERGVDPRLPAVAMQYATALLTQIVGGKPGPMVEKTATKYLAKSASVQLRRSQLDKVLGVAISDREVTRILGRIGRNLSSTRSGWRLTPPSYRFDLVRECDLIEEVARVHGYDRLPVVLPTGQQAITAPSESSQSLSRIRQFMVDRDYQEIISYSFIDQKRQADLDPQQTPVALANPLAENMAVMRTQLWPGLIDSAITNLNRQYSRVRLFEIGKVFLKRGKGHAEINRLGGLVTGSAHDQHWGGKPTSVDFFDLKGDLEPLFTLTGDPETFTFSRQTHPALHPGQCAQILKANRAVGWLGQLHPALQQQLEIDNSVFLFELDLDPLVVGVLPQFKSTSRQPVVMRDLAIVVDNTVSVSQVCDQVRLSLGNLLVSLKLFDIYQGPGVETGRKSVAMSLTLQHRSRTLADTEIEGLIDTTLAALKENCGADLRT